MAHSIFIWFIVCNPLFDLRTSFDLRVRDFSHNEGFLVAYLKLKYQFIYSYFNCIRSKTKA
jgi:hypothetical protein